MAANETGDETRNAWARKDMAGAYGRSFQTVIGQYLNRSEIDAVLELMQTRNGAVVLDAGCGTGRYLQELPPHVVRVGLDYSTAMVEIARHNDFTTPLAIGTLESMPFNPDSTMLQDGEFDKGILTRVLATSKSGTL